MNIFFLLLAILAGAFTTIESTINSQLGKYVTPGIATLHSLVVGMLFVLLINITMGNISKYPKVFMVSPIWAIGGVFGALIIYFSSKVIPELGISNSVILILSGQMVSSLVIESLLNHVEISLKKMMGMMLFLIGTIMFLKD